MDFRNQYMVDLLWLLVVIAQRNLNVQRKHILNTRLLGLINRGDFLPLHPVFSKLL